MAGMLARTADYQPGARPGPVPRYHRVVYLTSPAARGVVDRAAATLPGPVRGRMVVRDLPPGSVPVTFWADLRFRLLLWVLRQAGQLLCWVVLAAVMVAAAPVTLVAAVAYLGAWQRGWPPARLWRAALWALPMTAIYLAGQGLRAATLQAFALAPVRDWQAS
jgi:hypothetical protein